MLKIYHMIKEKYLFGLLSIIIFITGYFFLRYGYEKTDALPFVQEFILIVMGTLATVVITALLINKQTELELSKEQASKYLDLKAELYKEIINVLEEYTTKEKLDATDLKHLEFITHKLAIVASLDVLKAYNEFLINMAFLLHDKKISQQDADEISTQLSKLTIYLRKDLLGELDKLQDMKEIEFYIRDNTKRSIDNF